jgi:hypothetical protein
MGRARGEMPRLHSSRAAIVTTARFGRAAPVEVPWVSERSAATRRVQTITVMKDIAASLAVIIACGGIGGVAAWWAVGWLGLAGTAGALAAAAVGMVIAVAAFAGVTSLLRGIGWMK